MQSLAAIRSELLRLKWDIAASRFQLALRRHALALEKSGFNPNQPRVPAGRSSGGQWTSGGASGGGVSIRLPLALGDEAGLGILDEEGFFDDFYGYWDFVDFGELGFRGDLDLPDFSDEGQGPGIGHNQGPPIEDPSDIPEEKPETIKRGNRIARQVSRDPVLSTYYLLTIVAMGHRHWLNDMSWEIMADQDPPKTLDELYNAMAKPDRRGYERHHVVEQSTEEGPGKIGFPRSRIDNLDNLVLIPKYKHEQITAWYGTRNKDFGGLSPRKYLEGKSWEAHRAMGLKAMRDFGVLKP